jgi:hypothetical protein
MGLPQCLLPNALERAHWTGHWRGSWLLWHERTDKGMSTDLFSWLILRCTAFHGFLASIKACGRCGM